MDNRDDESENEISPAMLRAAEAIEQAAHAQLPSLQHEDRLDALELAREKLLALRIKLGRGQR